MNKRGAASLPKSASRRLASSGSYFAPKELGHIDAVHPEILALRNKARFFISPRLEAKVIAAILIPSAPAEIIALTAARLFDGQSNTLLPPGRLIINGTRIESVSSNATISPGARIIELGNATQLRGLTPGDSAASQLSGLTEIIPERTLAAFTTIRDLGGSRFINKGPRMLTVVNSIGTTGGPCDSTNGYIAAALSESNQNPAVGNGPDALRAAVRWNVKYGGVTSLNNDVDSPRLTQEEMNAHDPEGAKRAIRAGIDSIEHGSFRDDEGLKLMVAKGTYYVPILMAYEGVREGIAGGRLRLPLRLLVDHGMKPLDALKAATSVTADIRQTEKVFFVMKASTVYRNDRAVK